MSDIGEIFNQLLSSLKVYVHFAVGRRCHRSVRWDLRSGKRDLELLFV